MPRHVRGSSITAGLCASCLILAALTIPASQGRGGSGGGGGEAEIGDAIDAPDPPDPVDEPEPADAPDEPDIGASGGLVEDRIGGGSGSNRGSGSSGSNSGPGSSNSNSGSDSTSAQSRSAKTIRIEHDENGAGIRSHDLLMIEGSGAQAYKQSSSSHEDGRVDFPALGFSVLRLAVAEEVETTDALQQLMSGNRGRTITYDHLYALAGRSKKRTKTAAIPPQGMQVRGSLTSIGLVDTEIELQHPAIKRANIEPKTFHTGLADRSDHGTAIASLMISPGAPATASQGAKIFAADVFEGTTRGEPVASAISVAQALDWLCSQHVKVANLSLEGPANPLLELAVRRAQMCGMMIVAAAGNDGPASAPVFPAAYPNVIAVTAVDEAGSAWRHANRGSYISFAARGVDVEAADRFGTNAKYSGTSYAAPIVAVMLSQVLSKNSNPQAALAELVRRARDLGDPGRDPIFGFGNIALEKSVACTGTPQKCDAQSTAGIATLPH